MNDTTLERTLASTSMSVPMSAPMTGAVTTLSSREFNQRASDAKKAANKGPVFITDRGRPAHVLLSIEEYRRITGAHQKIADLLAMPGVEEIELELPAMRERAQAADFS